MLDNRIIDRNAGQAIDGAQQNCRRLGHALRHRLRHGSLWVGSVLILVLLAACGGQEEAPAPNPATTASPTTGTAAAAESTSPLPTSTAGISPTIPATATQPAPTPTTAVTATVSSNGAMAILTPLEVEEETDCLVESDLDLVGYPDLEEKMGCPVGPALKESVAINEFGEAQPPDRFMLWFSHEEAIYALLPDGTYTIHEDTWVEGRDPTYPCNPTEEEADSPPLPRRGFGKLWCNNPALQEIMGFVPREERLCQHSVLQRFEQGRLLACFEDATIRYFRLLENGMWDVQIQ